MGRPSCLRGVDIQKKRRRRRKRLNNNRSVTLLPSCTPQHPLYSSLSITLCLCFAARFSPPLKNVPLALVPLARLLAYLHLVTLSCISIGTEKTPEAATIVPSAPTYTRSLLGHLARSLAQAPLPSILEPRDLPRFHPFLSAPRVFSVGPPHIPGNSGATALPACIHRLPVMATATRKASATTKGHIEMDSAQDFGEQLDPRDKCASRHGRATIAAPSVEGWRSGDVSWVGIATEQLR